MATFTAARPDSRTRNSEFPHKLRVGIAAAIAASFIVWLTLYGYDYYRLDLTGRVESPLHPVLRPSGSLGLRLGMLGVALFGVLFLYPLRKRWRWLSTIGKTKHWLDFHAVVGITAPILITFHASFKFAGLAGLAYWIMIAVAVSGFIGRYLYTWIPRSLHATELTMGELDAQIGEVSRQLAQQEMFRAEELASLLEVPSPDAVRRMPVPAVLWTILRLDLRRPLLVSRLRRRVLGAGERLRTFGGLLPSSHDHLESVIASVRRQARLRTKAAFLGRVRQMLHLWHVVHRPFSLSFLLLVFVHLGVVVTLGYF
jgi:hypothetical protein